MTKLDEFLKDHGIQNFSAREVLTLRHFEELTNNEVAEVLGITKAYVTRVGGGPFPTELFDEDGKRLAKRGDEFGATTGRPRRCGWLDAVALRRMVSLNGVSGFCVTKLDVMDGMETVRICVAYELDGKEVTTPPVGADRFEGCRPIFIELPGWSESTVGAQSYDDLPKNAKAYLRKVEELCETPIDIISTGPDRTETMVLRHPFG